jgi:spore coat polysaccharide biosynthesis protein SpsF
MADLAIILTVRSDSERLKDKCFIEIRKRPLIYWIIKRLSSIKNSQVVLATTPKPSDNRLVEVAEEMNIPVFRGDSQDVVRRVDSAMKKYAPEAKLILRALGDMPFIATELVERACEMLLKHKQKEAFVWHLPPDVWPVYGAREFPFSRAGWDKIFRRSHATEEREHTDLFFHRNRRSFDILYHEPPKNEYFRRYRLEVDYQEDAKMIKALGAKIGLGKSLPEIIKFLDGNEKIAQMNREEVEKTGPLSSYAYQQQRIWLRLMTGKPVLDWKGKWWRPLNNTQVPIFCNRGHLLGFAQGGVLYTRNGEVQLEAGKIKCLIDDCGTSKIWHIAEERKARRY